MDFCRSRGCTPQPVRSRELVPEPILIMYLVTKIAQWKMEIHKHFEEPVEAVCWANMYSNLSEKIQEGFPRGIDFEIARDTNAGRIYGLLTVSR